MAVRSDHWRCGVFDVKSVLQIDKLFTDGADNDKKDER